MPRYTFHLIPHTHWDREWYLPRGRFGARLVPVLDDLIDQLEREPAIPGFLLDGQTVLLEDYLAVRPAQRPRVGRLVSQGRIETGPWYVLADEQIPSGESLVRNLLLGRKDTAGFSRGLPVLYSPDAFGHPAVLPALAAEFGIGSAVLWRGVQSERDLFRWRGTGGAEVLAYHLPPDGYEVGSALASDSARAREAWEPVRRALVRRAASSHVAVFIGADHHAARTDLVRLRDALAALEPESEVRLSRLGDFLHAARGIEMPVREGELREHGYTWALQGVHGTRSHQKRRNSRAELWLERYAEPLAALSMRAGGRDLRPLLEWASRRLVQCHFHDALGGCASDDVSREQDVRLTEVESIAREVTGLAIQGAFVTDPDRARDHPAGVRPSLLLWNPVPRQREGITFAAITRFRRDVLVGPPGNRVPRSAPEGETFALQAEGGEISRVQVLSTQRALERLDAHAHYPDQDEVDVVRVAFETPPVAGLGTALLTLVAGEPMPAFGGAEANGRRLSNEHVAITVASDGTLTVRDRETGVSRSGMLRLEAEPDGGDTYTFAGSRRPRLWRMRRPVQVRVLAAGPLVAALEIAGEIRVPRKQGGGGGIIRATMTLSLCRDDRVVRCTLDLANQAQDHRLRVRFPVGYPGRPARAGAQFGSTVRGPVIDRPHVSETPVTTAPAHRFVGIAGEPGFALFAPGFFEYELGTGGDLWFTVLRAVGQLSRGDLADRPGHAGWPTPTPLAQCPGPEQLHFAFALGGGRWGDPVMLHEQWEDACLPLRAAWFRDWNGEMAPAGSIELDGAGLMHSILKPAEAGRGMVLRCYNIGETDAAGTLRFGFVPAAVQRVRADESPLEGGSLAIEDQAVRFTARPGELLSFLVT